MKMKELIEKANSLQETLNYDNTELNHCCQLAINEIVDIIQEQESKSFNPVECGFTQLDDKEFIKYQSEKEYYIMTFRQKTEHFEAFMYIHIVCEYKKSNPKQILLPTINVKNHRFAIELLQGLGLIK